VTPFSISSEHTYRDQDGNTASLSPGPTMDIALSRSTMKSFRGMLLATIAWVSMPMSWLGSFRLERKVLLFEVSPLRQQFLFLQQKRSRRRLMPSDRLFWAFPTKDWRGWKHSLILA
jgi:hypothetical protein